MRAAFWLVVLTLAAAACAGPRTSSPGFDAPLAITLQEVAVNLSQPVHVWYEEARPDSILVVEQEGRVLRIATDGPGRQVVLHLRDRVGSGGERGLFAVAVSPDLPQRLFVHYTNKDGDTVVSSFSYDGETADPSSEAVFLRQAQPYPNHNGGQIVFHQGALFIGLGDGGGAGDPDGNGQDRSSLLGKILRILPGNGTEYQVPPDNPFVGEAGVRPEIWALGLRNPWRFSFDRQTGDLFIGDVGQNQWEEINHRGSSAPAGANFGWNRYEGRSVFRAGVAIAEHVGPIHVYATGPQGTCAVTGGHVYRGDAMPGLRGVYLFSDYCGGKIWGLQQRDGEWHVTELLASGRSISSFGEDASGEVYVTDRDGSVLRIVAQDEAHLARAV